MPRGAVACLAALVLAAPVLAQNYPTKTIRVIVPYPAGGATDFFLLATGRSDTHVSAIADNLVEAASPSNNPFLNPKVIKRTLDTGGGNLAEGGRRLVRDFATAPRVPSMVEPDAFEVGPDVLEFIASKIQTNIRELEGALIRVTAFANLNRQEVDMTLAEIVLKDLIPEGGEPEITAALIIAHRLSTIFAANRTEG